MYVRVVGGHVAGPVAVDQNSTHQTARGPPTTAVFHKQSGFCTNNRRPISEYQVEDFSGQIYQKTFRHIIYPLPGEPHATSSAALEFLGDYLFGHAHHRLTIP